MLTNMGSWDRGLRVLLAVVLVSLVIAKVATGLLAGFFLALAGISLVTAWLGYCPAYALFGLSTCPAGKSVRTR